jgi:hypothetical protein
MTMKRILHCTLMFMVLVTSGCDWVPGPSSSAPPNTNSQASPQVEKDKIDFSGAAEHVENAVTKLKTPNVTAKAARDEINKAIQDLGQDEAAIALRCGDCSETRKTEAVAVWNTLNKIRESLVKDSQKLAELEEEDVKTNLPKQLNGEAAKLRQLSAPETNVIAAPTPSISAVKTEQTTDDHWLWNVLMLSAKIIAVLLVLVLFATVVNYLWNRSWKTLESNVGQLVKAHVAAARDGQTDYTPKLSSLASSQAEMSSRLTELDTEVRTLARLVRDSIRRSDGNSSYGGFNYQSAVQEAPQKDEPEFPVSAVDYLGKMNRFANVVKPDFQNGILVNDPDGKGEFVLIRDSRDDSQALFVVPRATQFQTKQDFYTYYQKYYDCVRPSSGDVWILGPAVVEKVAGGWQLREKGMLEVR